MHLLTRFIFRFDFKMCPKFINGPGTAFSILQSSKEGFWEKFSESPTHRLITANFSSSDQYREITIDPMNINGNVEYMAGIDFAALEKDASFQELDKLSNALLKEYEITQLKRAGIRFFLVGQSPVAEGEKLKKLTDNLSETLRESVTSQLGDITDLGVLIEGQGKDAICYRATFGIHFAEDIEKFLYHKRRPKNIDQFVEKGFNFSCDLDFYEKDLSFAEFTLSKWSKTKIRKAKSFVDKMPQIMAGGEG